MNPMLSVYMMSVHSSSTNLLKPRKQNKSISQFQAEIIISYFNNRDTFLPSLSWWLQHTICWWSII